MTMVKSVLKSLSPVQVAQYLAGIAEHDVEKMRIAALKVILELLGDYCENPEIIQQVVKK
jgi:hypothetical protein